MKVDSSTRRDPNAFELVQSAQDSYSLALTATTLVSIGASLKPSTRINKLWAIRTKSFMPIAYIDPFPNGLRPFINNVKDFAADGNCSFRVIARLMGFEHLK